MVNINTLYKTVLYVLNKEQRGYIPPDEFNSLAQQVQFEIFQSYFPDGKQLNRQNQNNTQNDTEFFNTFKNNSNKLIPFESEIEYEYNVAAKAWEPQASIGNIQQNGIIYLYGDIIATYASSLVGNTSPQAISSGVESVVQLATVKDYNKITRSKLTSPTSKYPLATSIRPLNSTGSSSNFKVEPLPDFLRINCLISPPTPKWGFTVGSLGQYLFSSGSSQNFLLDVSEQSNLISGILKYAGIVINDPGIIDLASQEIAKVQANEKS